ncbi:MAG: hypothetical protein Q7T54_02850 [Candidatus Levybacteria bacterium]|nr:hypothetical protein [Candidatus Levybacteria bacterium]
MRETLTPYPFTATESRKTIEDATIQRAKELFAMPVFETNNQEELLSSFHTYYTFANMLFNEEEELRNSGTNGANLYYHGRQHAVQQVTYDAISIAKAIIQRNDSFSSHLSAEGTISILLGAMYHDAGYVNGGPVENYSARTPIHVDESIKELHSHLNLLGLPGVDVQKVAFLGEIGIHGTHFPYTENRLAEFVKLTSDRSPNDKKEAQIVRLSVQLADLGGQCARVDYFPDQVKALRAEMNETSAGLGTAIIGADHELAANCEFFLSNCVGHNPPPKRNVETTAIAFFGANESKPFRDAIFRIGEHNFDPK